MKRRPKLRVIEGGKKDPPPFPIELLFLPWLIWLEMFNGNRSHR
jgi:hypothetical protein